MKDKLIDFVSIQLDKDLKEPLYVQLYEQIKLMIKQHLLSPGYKLPAVRNSRHKECIEICYAELMLTKN